MINVDKAEVMVDGQPVEVTGKLAKALVENEGSHLVTVSAAGREPYEQTIDTKAGATVQVVAKLERAKSGSKKTTAGAKTTSKTTTPDAAASDAKKTAAPVVDKNAPIDPF